MKLNVVYTSSEEYAKYTYCSLLSLLDNNKDFDEICVFLIEECMRSETKELFRTLTEKEYKRQIIFISLEMDSLKFSSYSKWHGSKILYAKLYLPLLEELTDVEKVIVLDSDTIVVRSLKELWETKINNFYLAGVMVAPGIMDKYFKNQYLVCGCILYNLKMWREKSICDKVYEFRTEGIAINSAGAGDERILNYICKDNIMKIPYQYNVMSFLFALSQKTADYLNDGRKGPTQNEINSAIQNPCILHFTEDYYARPWKRKSKHPKKEMFLYYLEKSPWKGELEEGGLNIQKRTKNILLKVLPRKIYKLFRRVYFEKKRSAKV